MNTEQGFQNYVDTAATLSLFVPGLGQLLLIHWSCPVWFFGAIIAYCTCGISAGVSVHLLSFFHAAMLRRNVLSRPKRSCP